MSSPDASLQAENDAIAAHSGRVEPMTCTYNGTDKYGDPDSPWVFRDDVDRYAPVLECDVHGHPAQWVVYESSDTGPWSGPCEFFEHADTRVFPTEERAR